MNITNTDALIIVDPQNDFCPGGALAVTGGHDIMAPINTLAHHFKDADGLIVVTQDYHPKGHKSFASSWYMEPFSEIDMPYGKQTLWPDHCVQGSPMADFDAVIADAVALADLVIRKGTKVEVDSFSAFRENDKKTMTGLSGYLREKGIHRVFLTGLAFDYCVGESGLDAVEFGFDVVILKELTRSISKVSEQAMMEKLLVAGVVLI